MSLVLLTNFRRISSLALAAVILVVKFIVETIIPLSFLTGVSSVLISTFFVLWSTMPNTKREINVGQFKKGLLYFRVLRNLKWAILSFFFFLTTVLREEQQPAMILWVPTVDCESEPKVHAAVWKPREPSSRLCVLETSNWMTGKHAGLVPGQASFQRDTEDAAAVVWDPILPLAFMFLLSGVLAWELQSHDFLLYCVENQGSSNQTAPSTRLTGLTREHTRASPL